MDNNVFSLEDEDCEDLFITPEPSTPKLVTGDVSILDDGYDFSSPCVSLTAGNIDQGPIYEDISDDEDFNIPSSQPNSTSPRYDINMIIMPEHYEHIS